MTKSIALWLVALLLGGYGLFCLYLAATHQYWMATVIGLPALAGCLGLVFERRWSRFIVYLYSVVLSGVWIYGTQKSIAAGTWPYAELLPTMISLTPGLLFILLCAGSCVTVFRHFRAAAPRS